MKGLFSAAVASAITGAVALPAENHLLATRQSAGCSAPVTLSGNPFANRTLAPNKFYANEVKAAAANISDATLKAKALKVMDIGSFFWM
jgi:cellulose 1,4-beta-cellobiosidase